MTKRFRLGTVMILKGDNWKTVVKTLLERGEFGTTKPSAEAVYYYYYRQFDGQLPAHNKKFYKATIVLEEI